MTTLLLSIGIFALVFAAMAIGVLLGRKPIKGSCGGMSSLGMDTACDICGGDTKKCEDEQERQKQLAYNAVSSKVGSSKTVSNRKINQGEKSV